MKRFLFPAFILALVLLAPVPSPARQESIRILYVNDFHGFAQPHRPGGAPAPLGGIAYLDAQADRLRREKPSLLLAAGDMLQGHNWANLTRGKGVVELMNAMKFDAMVVGNHEFDFGQEVLRKRLAEARFPFLGANVDGFPGLKPYLLKTVGGVRVAVIGVVTPETAVATHPRNVAGLTFRSTEDTVRQCLKDLRDQADIFVVLSHQGLPADRALAQKVPGIDVIVGGHTHTKIDMPVVVGGTIIVQAWEHAKALGVLDLLFKDGKVVWFNGFLQEISPAAGAPDLQVEKIVAHYARQVDQSLSQAVGKTQVDLDGEQVRRRETNLGDLVADVLKRATGADCALINGGSIRASIPKGTVRLKELYNALPYDNYAVAVRLSGREVREALEHGVSALEENSGRFPQVSGLTFTYSPAAPPGARVREVTVRGQPLNPEGQYVVATNDFIAAGGDGYTVFAEALDPPAEGAGPEDLLKGPRLVFSDPSRWLRDLVADYFRAHKKVSPRVTGRIKLEVD
jgi:2',3'-cyclic-nucleotide 2'-phosphodiesterase (5'-nucleotidase family)